MFGLLIFVCLLVFNELRTSDRWYNRVNKFLEHYLGICLTLMLVGSFIFLLGLEG